MTRESPKRLTQMENAPPCGAKTRAGSACRCAAMRNGKGRIHGGLSPGAPRGTANGNYRNGYWTLEAVEERKLIRVLAAGTFVEKL